MMKMRLSTKLYMLLALLSLEGRAEVFPREAIADPSLPPERTTLSPVNFAGQNSQRTRIRYGPFVVPSTPEGASGHGHSIGSYKLNNASMPCRDCLITSLKAGIEYVNGSAAKADDIYFHHVLLANLGRRDSVCPDTYERFFASGNERVTVDLTANGATKTGYRLDSSPIALLAMLVNYGSTNATVAVTMEYEYILGSPDGFKPSTPLWLDIAGCYTSSEVPLKGTGISTYSMPVPHNVTNPATAIWMAGHLHDSGVSVSILHNNQTLCNSVAAYSSAPDQDHSDGSHTGSMPAANTHISDMSACNQPKLLKPGDKLSITADYDTTKHSPMTDAKGKMERIMGIAMVYMVEENNLAGGKY